MRMMTVHDMVEADFLKLPADANKSTLGMCLVIK